MTNAFARRVMFDLMKSLLAQVTAIAPAIYVYLAELSSSSDTLKMMRR